MGLTIRQAKARKLNLWRGHVAKAAHTTSSFDAIVLRIVNGDTIEVTPKQGGPRRIIQFSSIRQPKTNDPKQAAWQTEVKEYLRKRIIGKTVSPK
jgi:staphylococcal nuclease domain-containing protein 1